MTDDQTPAGKGQGFTSAVRVLRELSGPRFEAILAALSPETRALVERPPLAVAWVPIRHIRELLNVTHQVWCPNDVGAITELGRQVLLSDLNALYRVFIRIASPHYILERAAKLWSTYTRNTGSLRVVEAGDKFAEVAYADIPDPSSAYWAFQQGTVIAALTATGAKDIKVIMVNGGNTQSFARLRASWR